MANSLDYRGEICRYFALEGDIREWHANAELATGYITQKKDAKDCLHEMKEIVRSKTVGDCSPALQSNEVQQIREKDVKRLDLTVPGGGEGGGELDSSPPSPTGTDVSSSSSSSLFGGRSPPPSPPQPLERN